jgi:hypothetical protein
VARTFFIQLLTIQLATVRASILLFACGGPAPFYNCDCLRLQNHTPLYNSSFVLQRHPARSHVVHGDARSSLGTPVHFGVGWHFLRLALRELPNEGNLKVGLSHSDPRRAVVGR